MLSVELFAQNLRQIPYSGLCLHMTKILKLLKSQTLSHQEPSMLRSRVSVSSICDRFDLTIPGVHAIAHLAAGVSLSFTDPEPVLEVAIQGTLGVLESAITESSVKSVV